jgi:hypothetical protein
MEIPHRGPRPSLPLPEIYVHESKPEQFRSSSRSSSYNSTSSPATSAIPMSIPNSRDAVPPPLPPPKYLADIASGGNNGPDLAWRFGNSHGATSDWGGSMSSVAPGSSLYGSFAGKKSLTDDQPEYSRRTSSTSTIKSSMGREGQEHAYPKDEGYSSFSGTSIGSYRSVCQSQLELCLWFRCSSRCGSPYSCLGLLGLSYLPPIFDPSLQNVLQSIPSCNLKLLVADNF